MRYIAFLPDEAKTIVEGLQPYHRGNGTAQAHVEPLYVLNRLSNLDKHQAIHLLMVKPSGTSIRFTSDVGIFHFDLTPPDIGLEMNAQVGELDNEMLEGLINGEMDMNFTLEIEVAFADGPAQHRLVKDVWRELVDEVEAVITLLWPYAPD